MIRQCYIPTCLKLLGEIPPYEDKRITHGLCPDCVKKERIRLGKEVEEILNEQRDSTDSRAKQT